MQSVQSAIEHAPSLEVPNHLRNAPVKGMAQQGYGKGYIYPHDEPEGIAQANYFPVGMQHQQFYQPGSRGFEADILARIEHAKSILHTEVPT
jgi:putative ATPase